MTVKGKIARFKGTTETISGIAAWIEPTGRVQQLTGEIVIPERLRPKGILTTGTEVVYAYFDDHTGIILERTDGIERRV